MQMLQMLLCCAPASQHGTLALACTCSFEWCTCDLSAGDVAVQEVGNWASP
jgi:hypothetical protein